MWQPRDTRLVGSLGTVSRGRGRSGGGVQDAAEEEDRAGLRVADEEDEGAVDGQPDRLR